MGCRRAAGGRNRRFSLPARAGDFLPVASGAPGDGPRGLQIRTLSTHADRVSGGDVLVEISLPRAPRKGELIVSLNGRVVTNPFHETAPGRLVGLVTGLSDGNNRLTAEAKGLGTR